MLHDFWLNINVVKKCAPKMISFNKILFRKIHKYNFFNSKIYFQSQIFALCDSLAL